MVRWKIVIPIALVVLVAAGVLVIHLVLQSELVGRVALARASERLGMDVTAKSLHAGWGGETVIRELTVTMPLTDEPVLVAETVKLSHAAVPWLVLRRPFHLRSIDIEGPQVNVRQYESGRWNVQDVWAHLRTVIDSRERTERVALPRFAVHDGRIRITGPNDLTQTVGPMEFQAHPQGRLLWTFDLKLPSMAGIDGQLFQGGDWAHEVGFAVEGIGPLVRQLSQRDLSPVALSGRWEGRVIGDALNGRIQFTNATVGPAALRGDIRVEAGRDAITLRPEELVLTEPNLANEEIRLLAGAIRIARGAVTVEQLTAKTGTLTGRLDGRWDLGSRAGEFSGSWAAGLETGWRHQGVCKGVLQFPRFGRLALDGTLTAQTSTAAGNWKVAASLRGEGANWRKSQWQVSAPQIAWSRNDRQADIAGTAAQVDVNWPVIRLTAVHIPQAQNSSGGGEFDARSRHWSAHLEANALRLGMPWTDDIDFRLSIRGDHRGALMSEFRIGAGERVVGAQGELSFADNRLTNASIWADWPAGPVDVTQPQNVQPFAQWRLKAGLSGRIQPPALTMHGDLTGRNIPVGKQMVPHVAIPIHADIGAEQIQVTTEPFELLSGRWQLTGQHERSSKLTQLSLVVDDLSLKAAADIAGSPYASQGRADAQLQLAVANFKVRQAVATGKWTARDVSIPPLEAQKASGKIRIAGGLVRFDDIELEQGSGRAHAGMEFRLDHPQDVIVEITTESWPVRLPERSLAVLADGQANLHVNVASKMVEGQVGLSGKVWFRDQDLARIHVAAFVEGQTLDVQSLYAETLGGSLEGVARISLDRWRDSTANLTWREIQPQSLQRWWPQLGRFAGEVSGSLRVEQTSEQARPLGPMRVTVDAHAAGARYGPALINGCHIVGYLGEDRLLVDDAALQAFGGRIDLRGRVSEHAHARYASAITDFNNLDLDQLVHVVDPNAREYIGRVGGRISLLSSFDRLGLSGEGDIRLIQSDLVNNPAVAMLHSALSLKVGDKQPKGTGRVKIRLEGPALVIPSFEYFNRGIEIRGAGQIKDIDARDESPVQGYAYASTRVLKGISLPGVRSLDRLMASLQTGAAAVQIAGTLGGVEVKIVPLPIIGSDLRRLLWAQLRE